VRVVFLRANDQADEVATVSVEASSPTPEAARAL
jgi:hypothetical protein